ncbi:alkanesulfonate monooxygenase [Niveomyces insectorum RCEF 264]|uniref:Cyanuric acid amidohydrolase n=1 Tax=Niveomyces insectorum RCEF 264 TaxID=1081102 RepID=A0A167MH96_9HYPO|nr:alkanesulfonate monooxygenase [Niveomyces insectorum RCEF 264]
MPVEFISATFPNASTELYPLPDAPPVDPEFIVRYSRALDDYGFNYTLIPYSSGSFDPFTVGATVLAATKKISIIIALRPNTLYPTVAAKALATLDRLGGGRVVVHFIAGGSDAEQAREGDFLSKEERYAREEEYIRILKRAWASGDPFDWDGKYYTFKDFRLGVRPLAGKIPISVGGSSEDAYRVGGAEADIFGLWGEPLKETKEQIDKIYAAAEKTGRTDRPRIWVTFRPIIAETDELAWQKAHRTLDQLNKNTEALKAWSSQLKSKAETVAIKEVKQNADGKDNGTAVGAPPHGATKVQDFNSPQNVGSQRLLEIAKRGDVQDRALWYPTVTATNARGASTALVGSPQTLVDSILDYVDLGADLISIRGYDNLNDAVDYGRYILPGVRTELSKRGNGTKTKETEKEAAPKVDAVHKLAAGYNASQVIGVVGKSEGNGCVNDFSRTLSAVVWERLLSSDAVTIFSGGTEGILSPHVTFIVKDDDNATSTGILAAVGRTRKLVPEEVGAAEHARQVSRTVAGLIDELGVSRHDIGLVLIKCPLLTSSKIESIRAAGKTPVTLDTYESMAKSRYASAVGVAAALGEIGQGDLESALESGNIWSSFASCSSGAELDDCHVLVLSAAPSPGSLCMVSSYMKDAIDAASVLLLLDKVKEHKGKVVQVFVKAEADPSGSIRGFRHTMTTDSDIHSTRHARAAVGGLIAGLTGDCQIYVSGGAEGQGPPGGGSLCVVYSRGLGDE